MATITEDYVSFEIAKLLQEKGFPQNPNMCNTAYTPKGKFSNNAKSFAFYYELFKPRRYFIAPTHQMTMKWLREVHNIIIELESVWNGKKWEYLLFIVTPQNADSPYYEHNPYKSYEECVEAAIKYCLENLI